MNKYVYLSLSVLILNGCNEMSSNNPPSPKKIPYELKAHGDTRIDNYYWMRDDSRKDPEIIAHLNEENSYLENWFVSGNDYRKELFEEITDRIPKNEDSVPVRLKNFEYFRRYKQGNEYGIYIRRKDKNSSRSRPHIY